MQLHKRGIKMASPIFEEVDKETGLLLASESFTAIATRGNDYQGYQRFSFSITGEQAIKEYEWMDAEGFRDYLESGFVSTIDNCPPEIGQSKRVTGNVVFSESGDVIRFEDVQWSII